MAESKYKFDIPPELEAKIVEIQPVLANQVIKPDLEDNQKHWLVVGICLNSILSPALRKYIVPVVENAYQSVKQSYRIDQQVYPNVLKTYPPNYWLNYESINNNKSRFGRREEKFDFKVRDAVDFSKLYMLTHLANYTAFDDTCDLSVLLAIISSIDKFPTSVKLVANEIRNEVRNQWAHCNFGDWNVMTYQRSFQLINQLIRNMKFCATEESKILTNLQQWEIYGLHLLRGTTIGLEVVQEIHKHTCNLAEYSLKLTSETEGCFKKVHSEILRMQRKFESISENIDRLDDQVKGNQINIQSLDEKVRNLQLTADTIQAKQNEHTKLIESTVFEVDKRRSQQMSSYAKRYFQKYHDTTTQQQSEFRESDSYFFFAPNRLEHFIGRDEEMACLLGHFDENFDKQHVQAICGLGGCGKTALCIEFSWRYRSHYPGGIFWISAESSETLENTLLKLATKAETIGNTPRETLYKTLNWMSKLSQKWLLVVDNLDEEILSINIREVLLGEWRQQSFGHFLITTRREPMAIEEIFLCSWNQCIVINSLSEHDAITFMKNRANRTTDDENEIISDLVVELGGLPLALEQASAHIKILRCSFLQYMEKFKKLKLKLLREAESRTSVHLTKERLTCQTTWEMNFDYIRKQSQKEGLGDLAAKVMEVSSLLYAEDIPEKIINSGLPPIEQYNFKDKLQDDLDVKRVTEILCRFSLFQRSELESFSLHRLVQEVIRQKIIEEDRIEETIQLALRMINKAIKETNYPCNILKKANDEDLEDFKSYELWKRLAVNANELKTNFFKFINIKTVSDKHLFTLEACFLFQSTAVYHSIQQRQVEALEDQSQLLQIIVALDINDQNYEELISIKIPLLERDRMKLQKYQSKRQTSNTSSSPETLRLKGNEAYESKQYNEAIRLYSAAIQSNNENVDFRLYSNRSAAYIMTKDYQNALNDADKCIELNAYFWKGFYRKAIAIARMKINHSVSPELEACGLASAAFATGLNKKLLSDKNFTTFYPQMLNSVSNVIVQNPNDFNSKFTNIHNSSAIYLVLHKGQYTLSGNFSQSVFHIIGIEDGVDISTGNGLAFTNALHDPKNETYIYNSQETKKIKVYLENINFTSSGGQISFDKNAFAVIHNCTFRNGQLGCTQYPRCNGGSGCIAPNRCKSIEYDLTVPGDQPSGKPGFYSIYVLNGGEVIINKCLIEESGGGVLIEGIASKAEIYNCTIKRTGGHGIEARNGGMVNAIGNSIMENRSNGISVYPSARGVLGNNVISGNNLEGVKAGNSSNIPGIGDLPFVIDTMFVISGNIIYQNGLTGITLLGGMFQVDGNKIYENWTWGMSISNRSSTHILNNELFSNKCGGVSVCFNYSASITLDGNTIRNHSGPAIYDSSKNIPEIERQACLIWPKYNNECSLYSNPPIITTRNFTFKNNTGIVNPRYSIPLLRKCCYCHSRSSKLKTCSQCRIATYCSRECQVSHWARHKPLCRIFCKSYLIDIKLSQTKTLDSMPLEQTYIYFRFLTGLKKAKQVPTPDLRSSKRFIVKLVSPQDNAKFDPSRPLLVFDRSLAVQRLFSNQTLYFLLHEFGVVSRVTTKMLYLWASFKANGTVLSFQTDTFPCSESW